MERYLMWSGGKDSSASIVLCYENGIHLDGIVMSEVMFDHSRNISGEDIEHITWVKNVAIPIIEKMGYKVYLLRDETDYLYHFNHIVTRSKKTDRNGKRQGFFLAGACRGNNYLKMRPIEKFLKEHKGCEQVVGIAIDEPERLDKMHKRPNRISVLEQFNIAEEQTYEICKKYNLLSPTYKNNSRGGCWFCPKQRLSQLKWLYKEHNDLWNILKDMEKDSFNTFKPNKTLTDLESKFKEE